MSPFFSCCCDEMLTGSPSEAESWIFPDTGLPPCSFCCEAMRSAVLVEPENVYGNRGAGHSPSRPAPAMSDTEGPFPQNDQFWRQEVISRVQQHRARRRKRCDPNAMELDFPAGNLMENGP